MGLDKKLASPKLKKEKSIEKREELKKGEGKLRKTRKHIILKQNDLEGSKASASVMFSAQEENTGVEEVRTAVEEMERTGQPRLDVWEDDHQNMLKYGNGNTGFSVATAVCLSFRCDFQNVQK